MTAHGSRNMLLGITTAALFALADSSHGAERNFCAMTAHALFDACNAQVAADNNVARAVCINISDPAARDQCFEQRKEDRIDGLQLCSDQRDWRLSACTSLGNGRYDPNFDPAHFDDPKSPTNPNAYFPLAVHDRWDYAGGGEHDTVEVADATKLIDGVPCIVVKDVVTDSSNNDLRESTNDWYASAKDGNTWYCGEETAEFESFDNDNPRVPELVDIEGSFKVGRDGAKPGIIALASPKPGDVYLEEFSLANAEDVTEILSTTYTFGNDPELDHLVPQQLADRFCSGNCIVTKNFSLLEPGIIARKYYALGIGV